MKKILFVIIFIFFLGCSPKEETIASLDFNALDYVDLPNLNELTIDRKLLELSKDELDAIICMNLSYNNIYKTVTDRTSLNCNDIVLLNLEITLNDSIYFTENQLLYFLGSLEYPEAFEQTLLTMSKGHSSNVDIFFPADYPNSDLAGNTANFTVCICEILCNVEMDDTDIILAFYECEDIKQVYRKITKESNKIVIYDYIINTLLDTCPISQLTPQGITYIDKTLAYYTQAAQQDNQTLDNYLKAYFDSDVQTLTKEIEKFYKEIMLVKAITETEGIKYTPKDVYAQAEKMALEDDCTTEEILINYDELTICYEMLSEDAKNILYTYIA